MYVCYYAVASADQNNHLYAQIKCVIGNRNDVLHDAT